MPNRLNDLDSKTWLKFQKSWFIHNPPPRKKGVLRHPAKFPETMAQEFIEFFTKKGETVLDPMAGTGSTLIAALRAGRNSYGIELNPKYAEIAVQVIDEERAAIIEKERIRQASGGVEKLRNAICRSVCNNLQIPVRLRGSHRRWSWREISLSRLTKQR